MYEVEIVLDVGNSLFPKEGLSAIKTRMTERQLRAARLSLINPSPPPLLFLESEDCGGVIINSKNVIFMLAKLLMEAKIEDAD